MAIRERLRLTPSLFGWADQIVVSGAGFVILVMIARWTGAGQLGAYAICQSIMVLLVAAQDALITRPYTIQLYRPHGTPAEHAFGALALSLSGAFLAGLAVLSGGFAAAALGWPVIAPQAALAMACAVPMVMLREFIRRYCFAHLRTFEALLLDCGVAGLAVALLAFLGLSGHLTLASALLAIGCACAIGSLTWLALARRHFAINVRGIGATLRQSWGLGKWLLAGQIAMQAQGYMTHWISVLVAGVAATGVYAASMSIVAFSNPVLFGFFNILTPKYVRALKERGTADLTRQARRDAFFLGGVMAGFCLLIAVAGEPAMALLFHGPEFEGQGPLLIVLALSVLASAIGGPASIALMALERGRLMASLTAITSLFSVGLIWWLISGYGLQGAAFAMLIAEAIGSAVRWAALLASTRSAQAALGTPTAISTGA